MKKTIVVLAVALAIPTGVAFAKANPKHAGGRDRPNPLVTYVLRGALSNYVAATSAGDGSISITVTHSNFHSMLKGQTMTFSTSVKTKINFRNGATQITDGAKGVLRFRAPLHRKGAATLETTLTTRARALHIVDQAGQ